MAFLLIVICSLFMLPIGAYAGSPMEVPVSKPLPLIPLSLDELLARIDRTHPLLMGVASETTTARGKLLVAQGAFEPTLINDTELERFVSGLDPSRGTQTVGYNDTVIEALHPWGFRGSAGFRQAIGSARIPDLSFGDGNQQVILGGFLPLLKGLVTNPERAELQRSELAFPLADLKIAQTRQDLFLAAASQFWDWVAAVKLVDVQTRSLAIATDRQKQVEERARAGAVPPIDVVEASQEVQRRREVAIAAQRLVEQEQLRLSMFLWENGTPTIPPITRAPEFPVVKPAPAVEDVIIHKLRAQKERPEVQEIDIEAKINHIDLKLAKNNLLPNFDLEAAPARAPEKFVLGLGYRFGVELRFPFQQKRSRGEVLKAEAQAIRLLAAQKVREQQVFVDVDNALSAIHRANERIEAANASLRLAKELEEGEQFRFGLGATSVLFVNLRERNTVDSENQVIRAKADYHKALAFYQWAIGSWAKSPQDLVPVSYR